MRWRWPAASATGVAAFAVKLVTSEFGSGPACVFTNWPVYVLAVVGPVGFVLNQDGIQQSRLLGQPVQAIITTSRFPVISIALGVLWHGARLRGSPAEIVGEVVSLLLMTAGIVTIAHDAPSGQKAQSSSGASCPTRLRTMTESDIEPGRAAHGRIDLALVRSAIAREPCAAHRTPTRGWLQGWIKHSLGPARLLSLAAAEYVRDQVAGRACGRIGSEPFQIARNARFRSSPETGIWGSRPVTRSSATASSLITAGPAAASTVARAAAVVDTDRAAGACTTSAPTAVASAAMSVSRVPEPPSRLTSGVAGQLGRR